MHNTTEGEGHGSIYGVGTAPNAGAPSSTDSRKGCPGLPGKKKDWSPRHTPAALTIQKRSRNSGAGKGRSGRWGQGGQSPEIGSVTPRHQKKRKSVPGWGEPDRADEWSWARHETTAKSSNTRKKTIRVSVEIKNG